MTRRWTSVPLLTDLEDNRLIIVECDANDQDCIVDAGILFDHNQCFIQFEEC